VANPVKAVPEDHPTVTPGLVCKGAARAIDFYKQVFGAKELMRMEGPGGSIGHAELMIGNSKIMLNDEFSGMAMAPSGCTGHTLYIYVEDCDGVFNRAIAAGATAVMPPMNQFWGDRHGVFTDPFGHRWNVATHVEDVAPAEMERRAKEWMAKAAGQSASAGHGN
jgi:PhnB protein